MSHNSKNRDLYFNSKIEHQETAERYVKSLLASPYRSHQRAGRVLLEEFNNMVAEELKNQKEDELENTETN